MVRANECGMVEGPALRIYIEMRSTRREQLEEVCFVHTVSAKDSAQLDSAARNKAFTEKGALT